MCFSTLKVVTYSGWILNSFDKTLVVFDSFFTVWYVKEVMGHFVYFLTLGTLVAVRLIIVSRPI